MQEQKKKNNKILIINICIIASILIIVSIISVIFSKYITRVDGTASIIVAHPKLALYDSNNILYCAVPTCDDEIIFSVDNSESYGIMSQVALKYNIQVESCNNLPLEFELYKYENSERVGENLFYGTGSTTKDFLIEHTVDTSHCYCLVVKWTDRDYKYSNTLDYIRITVNAAQTD